ncbi:MAG: hypothetical protein HYW65_04275 [Candidatus Liptonbacteria bacterium]|nr:hypothetical protein [Candidatus Liptonbacteria bacterium]
MKQTTKRLMSMIVSLLLMGGAAILFFNFIQPAYADVQALKSEVLVREEFVRNEQDAVKKVQQLISAYNNQAERREFISLVLPLTADVSGALTQLAGLVQNDTLGAQAFTVSEEGDSSGWSAGAAAPKDAVDLTRPLGTLSLQVAFTGSYENVKNFLEKLETNIRVFDAISFGIAPSAKPNQDLYKVDLRIATYYQKN